jgi:hypothetical protein
VKEIKLDCNQPALFEIPLIVYRASTVVVIYGVVSNPLQYLIIIIKGFLIITLFSMDCSAGAVSPNFIGIQLNSFGEVVECFSISPMFGRCIAV